LQEAQVIQEFAHHLDLPSLPEPNLEDTQTVLQSLAQTVGTPAALVYARFKPVQEPEIALHPGDKAMPEPQPTDVLQLVMITPGGPPQQIIVPGATREKVSAAVQRLQRELTDRTRRRQTTYLEDSQQLYRWLVAPLEAELGQQGIGHLSFIMSPGLRSLPLAALHDGEQFIIERYTVGLMPSLALTDTRYTDLRQAPVLAMGASQFTDQRALPAVPFELSTIVGQLRTGQRNLNETFTPQDLVTLRQASGYNILHLATHGEFRPGELSNSYIQFWDQRVSLDQIRRLQLHEPPLDLLVMSACQTALGDTHAELGFAGLAVQSGARSALATLWQVSDLETAGLMAEFYTQLGQQPYKAEALRQAQLAMLRGEVFVADNQLRWQGGSQPLPPELAGMDFGDTRHPYFWSAFTLVGSPW
jgi:CHAT domain-containing protein